MIYTTHGAMTPADLEEYRRDTDWYELNQREPQDDEREHGRQLTDDCSELHPLLHIVKTPCDCGREDRRVCIILGCGNELIWPDAARSSGPIEPEEGGTDAL